MGETHLSTLEPGTQAPPRFPRAYGHQSWPQDPERTSCARPQIAERVSASGTIGNDTAGGPRYGCGEYAPGGFRLSGGIDKARRFHCRVQGAVERDKGSDPASPKAP